MFVFLLEQIIGERNEVLKARQLRGLANGTGLGENESPEKQDRRLRYRIYANLSPLRDNLRGGVWYLSKFSNSGFLISLTLSFVFRKMGKVENNLASKTVET